MDGGRKESVSCHMRTLSKLILPFDVTASSRRWNYSRGADVRRRGWDQVARVRGMGWAAWGVIDMCAVTYVSSMCHLYLPFPITCGMTTLHGETHNNEAAAQV